MKPSTQSVTLPKSLTWETAHHPSFSHFDLDWPPSDRADRVVTQNYGIRVVVCLPLFALPYIEETAPIFSHLGVSVTPADAETVETILAAVADHLKPVHGPANCWYGVKFEEVQTLSNMPSAFVRDVETLAHSVGGVTDIGRRYPTGDQPPRWARGIHAAAVWPVDVGWFYLEYTQRVKEQPGLIKYGLLTRGELLTSEPVEPFFDAVEQEWPTVQDRWPQRALIVTSTHSGAQPTRTEAVDQRVRTRPDASQPPLPIHGSNPLYATAAEDIDTVSEPPPGTLYDSLCRTSTLLYDPGTSFTRDGGLQLKHLYSVQPPTASSLNVCALGG